MKTTHRPDQEQIAEMFQSEPAFPTSARRRATDLPVNSQISSCISFGVPRSWSLPDDHPQRPVSPDDLGSEDPTPHASYQICQRPRPRRSRRKGMGREEAGVAGGPIHPPIQQQRSTTSVGQAGPDDPRIRTPGPQLHGRVDDLRRTAASLVHVHWVRCG
ncbi:hypothetical protein N7462_008424 [Penicillium macrosclerotiorum]|uniref:uncharacterized protein n=1 Tax=Penicillium macrosclerotiorum TaxID=303699 RepID=UPI002547974C|nr:uncharacterized protein N7462_008424 [Penicillium macrosclerotiorum]KAJ5675527.1 hypothetical protein N7462_008424 [Penicillium macrosclerotiorum]